MPEPRIRVGAFQDITDGLVSGIVGSLLGPDGVTIGRPRDLAHRVDVILVSCARGETRRLIQNLDSAFAVGLAERVIVLAPLVASVAEVAARRICGGVVWVDQPHPTERLRLALTQLGPQLLSSSLYSMFASVDPISPVVKRALHIGLLAPDPPTNVGDLAKRTFVANSTLRGHWAVSGLPGGPKAFLDWVVLSLFVDGTQDSGSGAFRGVARSTVDRAARRRVGVSACRITKELALGAAREWVGGIGRPINPI